MSTVRLACFVLLACAAFPAAAQYDRDSGRDRQVDRPSRPERFDRAAKARERCKADRGVDCDTPQGLREWELLERSRQEALRAGSRHRVPPQPR